MVQHLTDTHSHPHRHDDHTTICIAIRIATCVYFKHPCTYEVWWVIFLSSCDNCISSNFFFANCTASEQCATGLCTTGWRSASLPKATEARSRPMAVCGQRPSTGALPKSGHHPCRFPWPLILAPETSISVARDAKDVSPRHPTSCAFPYDPPFYCPHQHFVW